MAGPLHRGRRREIARAAVLAGGRGRRQRGPVDAESRAAAQAAGCGPGSDTAGCNGETGGTSVRRDARRRDADCEEEAAQGAGGQGINREGINREGSGGQGLGQESQEGIRQEGQEGCEEESAQEITQESEESSQAKPRRQGAEKESRKEEDGREEARPVAPLTNAKALTKNKNPAIRGGVQFGRSEPGGPRGRTFRRSGGDALVEIVRLTQHVAAAPDGLDEIAAFGGVGELLAQLADEDVDDLQFRLVHDAI